MHKARRVVRTEHNYCINQAELKGMRDAGFDEYEFASLGENADGVCHTCDDLDGERFKIEDAVVGVNCPPMHPFCRCKATTPMETKEDVQADIDRLLDGRSIEDIERELDRQIAEQNALPEPVESPVEATQQESYSTLNSVQESAEENSDRTVDISDNSGIIEEKEPEKPMQEICKIDLSKFKGITDKKILTDDVVLTSNREKHIIERRGQDFYDKYRPCFAEILTSPDYIFPDKNPDTALVSKTYTCDNKTINIVLRLVVEGDDPRYKNSIISAIGEGNDRFEQRLNNNTPVYKRLDNQE